MNATEHIAVPATPAVAMLDARAAVDRGLPRIAPAEKPLPAGAIGPA